MQEKLEYFIILLDFGRATTAISKNTRTQASKPYNDQIPFSVSSESTFPIIRAWVVTCHATVRSQIEYFTKRPDILPTGGVAVLSIDSPNFIFSEEPPG